MSLWKENLERDLRKGPEAFKELIEVVARLRQPEHGCPWDLEQDHKSLRRFMLEEAYEAAEAMGGNDSKHLQEELGDVLLQVVLNSQLISDSGGDGITAVIQEIKNKMVRRHPHVFTEDMKGLSIKEVKDNWSRIKSEEKPGQGLDKGLFHKEKKSPFPSLMQAYKIGKKAEKVKFDWDDVSQVWGQFLSEVKELEDEITAKVRDPEKVMDELGDVFFSLSQVSRHLGIDPEVAALGGNQKFLRRFDALEQILKDKSLDLQTLTVEDLQELWLEVKAKEKAAK